MAGEFSDGFAHRDEIFSVMSAAQAGRKSGGILVKAGADDSGGRFRRWEEGGFL